MTAGASSVWKMRSAVASASGSLRSASQHDVAPREGTVLGGARSVLYSVPHIGWAATKRPRRACIEITCNTPALMEPRST